MTEESGSSHNVPKLSVKERIKELNGQSSPSLAKEQIKFSAFSLPFAPGSNKTKSAKTKDKDESSCHGSHSEADLSDNKSIISNISADKKILTIKKESRDDGGLQPEKHQIFSKRGIGEVALQVKNEEGSSYSVDDTSSSLSQKMYSQDKLASTSHLAIEEEVCSSAKAIVRSEAGEPSSKENEKENSSSTIKIFPPWWKNAKPTQADMSNRSFTPNIFSKTNSVVESSSTKVTSKNENLKMNRTEETSFITRDKPTRKNPDTSISLDGDNTCSSRSNSDTIIFHKEKLFLKKPPLIINSTKQETYSRDKEKATTSLNSKEISENKMGENGPEKISIRKVPDKFFTERIAKEQNLINPTALPTFKDNTFHKNNLSQNITKVGKLKVPSIFVSKQESKPAAENRNSLKITRKNSLSKEDDNKSEKKDGPEENLYTLVSENIASKKTLRDLEKSIDYSISSNGSTNFEMQSDTLAPQDLGSNENGILDKGVFDVDVPEDEKIVATSDVANTKNSNSYHFTLGNKERKSDDIVDLEKMLNLAMEELSHENVEMPTNNTNENNHLSVIDPDANSFTEIILDTLTTSIDESEDYFDVDDISSQNSNDISAEQMKVNSHRAEDKMNIQIIRSDEVCSENGDVTRIGTAISDDSSILLLKQKVQEKRLNRRNRENQNPNQNNENISSDVTKKNEKNDFSPEINLVDDEEVVKRSQDKVDHQDILKELTFTPDKLVISNLNFGMDDICTSIYSAFPISANNKMIDYDTTSSLNLHGSKDIVLPAKDDVVNLESKQTVRQLQKNGSVGKVCNEESALREDKALQTRPKHFTHNPFKNQEVELSMETAPKVITPEKKDCKANLQYVSNLSKGTELPTITSAYQPHVTQLTSRANKFLQGRRRLRNEEEQMLAHKAQVEKIRADEASDESKYALKGSITLPLRISHSPNPILQQQNQIIKSLVSLNPPQPSSYLDMNKSSDRKSLRGFPYEISELNYLKFDTLNQAEVSNKDFTCVTSRECHMERSQNTKMRRRPLENLHSFRTASDTSTIISSKEANQNNEHDEDKYGFSDFIFHADVNPCLQLSPSYTSFTASKSRANMSKIFVVNKDEALEVDENVAIEIEYIEEEDEEDGESQPIQRTQSADEGFIERNFYDYSVNDLDRESSAVLSDAEFEELRSAKYKVINDDDSNSLLESVDETNQFSLVDDLINHQDRKHYCNDIEDFERHSVQSDDLIIKKNSKIDDGHSISQFRGWEDFPYISPSESVTSAGASSFTFSSSSIIKR